MHITMQMIECFTSCFPQDSPLVAEEVSVEAPAIEVEEGASVVEGGATVIGVEEEALATVDVVALEEEEVNKLFMTVALFFCVLLFNTK